MTITTSINESVTAWGYLPDNQCFDWCVAQQVVHSNNMEVYAIRILIVVYFLLVLYFIAGEVKFLQRFNRDTFIYWAKLLMIIFFGFYILVIRMRLIW